MSLRHEFLVEIERIAARPERGVSDLADAGIAVVCALGAEFDDAPVSTSPYGV